MEKQKPCRCFRTEPGQMEINRQKSDKSSGGDSDLRARGCSGRSGERRQLFSSQLFGSLVCDQSYFYLMFKIFSLFSFNILFLWYISVWISLPSLRIINLGINILHPIYKVINHYIFEIFKFLLLSSSPQELWLYLRYCCQWSLTFLKTMFILTEKKIEIKE